MTKHETVKIDEILNILRGGLTPEEKGLIHIVRDLSKAQEADEEWKKETGVTLEALKVSADLVLKHEEYIEKEKDRRIKQAGIAAGSGGFIGGVIALWDKIQGVFQ